MSNVKLIATLGLIAHFGLTAFLYNSRIEYKDKYQQAEQELITQQEITFKKELAISELETNNKKLRYSINKQQRARQELARNDQTVEDFLNTPIPDALRLSNSTKDND